LLTDNKQNLRKHSILSPSSSPSWNLPTCNCLENPSSIQECNPSYVNSTLQILPTQWDSNRKNREARKASKA